jgi:ABC-type antimicrobial peptide transport system permease subunit
MRRAVESIAPEVPVSDVRTQTEQIDATMSRERLFATLATALGLLALTLACIGIYGVMAHAVARRTSEIGIRIALGAQRSEVLRMILRETGLVTVAGVLIGVTAAAALTRYVRTMLYGLEPMDPLAFGAAVAVMSGVAFVAGWWPARVASRVDPVLALRHE